MLLKCKSLRQLAFWLLLCLAGLITAGHNATAADWTVSVEFDKTEVRVGENFRTSVYINNTSGATIQAPPQIQN